MDKLGRIIGIGLLAAALLNGAGFFLKRVGLIDHQAYRAYIADFCAAGNESAWLGNRCQPWRRSPRDPGGFERYDRGHLYASEGAEILFKLAKYLFIVFFILLSLVVIRQGDHHLPTFSSLRPVLPLAVGVGISTVMAYLEFGALLTLGGLRAFSFLAVALVGSGFATEKRLSDLAIWVGLLLLLQLFIVSIEVGYGIPLEKGYRISPDLSLPSRMAGSFVMPNSLGVFAILGLAFYYAFSIRRRYFYGLVVAVMPLLLLSRSGTGVVGLFVLLAMDGLARVQKRYRRYALVGISIIILLFLFDLPFLLGRADLLDSLWARVDNFSRLFTLGSFREILFGQGVGVGTNTWNTLVMARLEQDPSMDISPFINVYIMSDSTLVMLFAQTGLLGVVSFYGLIGWGMWKDQAARVFYLMVLLTSLTLNITELFPVGFLLGLVLSRGLAAPPSGSAPTKISPGSQRGAAPVEQGR